MELSPNKKATGRVYFGNNPFDSNGEIDSAIEDTFVLVNSIEKIETKSEHLTKAKEEFKIKAKEALRKTIFESMSVQIENFMLKQVSKRPQPRIVEESEPDDLVVPIDKRGRTDIYDGIKLDDFGDAIKYKGLEDYDPKLIYGVVSKSRKTGEKPSQKIVSVDSDRFNVLLEKSKKINLSQTNPSNPSMYNEMKLIEIDLDERKIGEESFPPFSLDLQKIKERLEEIKNRNYPEIALTPVEKTAKKKSTKKKTTKKKATKKKSAKKSAKKKTSKKKTTKRSKNARTKRGSK